MRIKMLLACLAVSTLIAAALGPSKSVWAAPAARGGALTVLAITSQWPGLDPATDTQASADYDYMNAIYGQLFEPGPHGTIVPDLTTGYHYSKDGLTLTVGLREGVTFQDGTPFTAAAVKSSIERDLDPKNACACDADFAAVRSITTSGDHTLVLHLSSPDYALVDAWADNESPNWTVSPTALAKEGATGFSLHPVGAGPFEVVSNSPSQKLVLQAFPKYWQRGKPGLRSLTFMSIGNESTAYDALQAGQAQFVTNFATFQTLAQARKNPALKVVTLPGLHTLVVQLNTKIAPFNNKLAREALYYATNSKEYLRVIGGGQGTLTQSPTGPGGLFFEKKVPGYRTYNLGKSKQLVKQLGSLSFTYGIGDTAQAETQGAALQSMWVAAGMNVKLQPETFGDIVAGYKNNSWQASAEAEGSFDPSIGTSGLSIRFSSNGILSGVTGNPGLDALIKKAVTVAKPQKRKAIYDQIFKIIANEAYGPNLYAPSGSVVFSKSVTGVHPVTQGSFGPLIEWQDIGSAT